MRFYKIAIWHTDPKTHVRTKLFRPKSMEALKSEKWSYFSVDDDGVVLTSALDVYLDIDSFQLGEGRTGSTVRISGIGLEDIAQFTYLAYAEIEVYGGMLSGYLPLAHENKPDLLMRGTILWASGNWEGVNTTLDLILSPVIGLAPELAEKQVMNMTFDWKVGDKLEPAIKETLTKTYGKSASNPNGYDIKIEISDNLVAQTAMSAAYPNLSILALGINKATSRLHFPSIKPINGLKYDGVIIKVFDKTITVYDQTKPVGKWTKDSPMDIPFQDLIGQPVWKDTSTLVFKTVMRGDVEIANWIKLPKFLASPYVLTSGGTGQAPNEPAGFELPSKSLATFSGVFQIVKVRHIGQFRQSTAHDWVTVIDAQSIPSDKKADSPLKAFDDPNNLINKAFDSPQGSNAAYPDPREAQGSPLQQSNPTNPLRTPPPAPPSTTNLPPFVIHPPVFPN